MAAGVSDKIQFVGSMTDNTQNCKSNATDGKFDLHHEGHSGYLAINIANTNLVGWLSSAKPDIVMFMLGTNDVGQGHNTADILAAYTKMVTEMRASNPNMKILVSLDSAFLVERLILARELTLIRLIWSFRYLAVPESRLLMRQSRPGSHPLPPRHLPS